MLKYNKNYEIINNTGHMIFMFINKLHDYFICIKYLKKLINWKFTTLIENSL